MSREEPGSRSDVKVFGAFHEVEESLILQSHVRIKGKKVDKSHAQSRNIWLRTIISLTNSTAMVRGQPRQKYLSPQWKHGNLKM